MHLDGGIDHQIGEVCMRVLIGPSDLKEILPLHELRNQRRRAQFATVEVSPARERHRCRLVVECLDDPKFQCPVRGRELGASWPVQP